MFITVDLPEPLGPMTATNSPWAMSRSMPRERLELRVAATVDAGDAAQADQGIGGRGVHQPCPAARWSMITCIPGASSGDSTSVIRPSLMPGGDRSRRRLGHRAGPRSGAIRRRGRGGVVPTWPRPRPARAASGCSERARPLRRGCRGPAGVAVDGVKRSALFGTSSTSRRSVADRRPSPSCRGAAPGRRCRPRACVM